MERREFLRTIATLGIAAAVPLELVGKFLPAPVASVPPHGEPISYAALEEAYLSMSYGNEEPTLMLMSPDVFHRVLDMIPKKFHFSSEARDVISRRFNGADMCMDPTMPDARIRFINEGNPDNPHLNGWLNLE